MEAAIQKITAMLQSPDGMRRCAAAMVLAELAPKDARVVHALGQTLKDANPLLTRYVLEALDAIGTREVVPYVMPLLESPDMETKLRAAAIVAQAGGDIVSELKPQLAKASPQQRLVLMDILARIHTRDAMALILEALLDRDAQYVQEVCQAVRRHCGTATASQRIALHQQVVKFMNRAIVRKNERAWIGCLLLIGYLGAPAARAVLLKHSAPRMPVAIRHNALVALRNLPVEGSATVALGRQLVKYLNEPDFANVVQPTLDILEKLRLPPSFATVWRKLLHAKHGPVRVFAARQVAATDDGPTNRLLLQLLQHDDVQVSEIAAGALAHHKGATRLLLDALLHERAEERAWRLAKILKPHSPAVDKKTAAKIAALAMRELQRGEPRAEALLYLLRNVNPPLADSVWREAGLRFKKARKWARAVECFKKLGGTESFDNDVRYELSVCQLKLSPRHLLPHLRAEDPALRGFQALLEKGDKLAERLLKDKTLDAADLAYVGFHFAERAGAERQLGETLLAYIARKWPRTKEGKAARNKLKLIQQSAAATAPVPSGSPAT